MILGHFGLKWIPIVTAHIYTKSTFGIYIYIYICMYVCMYVSWLNYVETLLEV